MYTLLIGEKVLSLILYPFSLLWVIGLNCAFSLFSLLTLFSVLEGFFIVLIFTTLGDGVSAIDKLLSNVREVSLSIY